jgi:hypothetical protein
LGLARAVTLWSKSCRTHDHILLSHMRLTPTWWARSPYLYPPHGTGWPSYTPGTGFPPRHLLRHAGLQWWYSNTPSHGTHASEVWGLRSRYDGSWSPFYSLGRTAQRTSFPFLRVCCCDQVTTASLPSNGCLKSRSLANGCLLASRFWLSADVSRYLKLSANFALVKSKYFPNNFLLDFIGIRKRKRKCLTHLLRHVEILWNTDCLYSLIPNSGDRCCYSTGLREEWKFLWKSIHRIWGHVNLISV